MGRRHPVSTSALRLPTSWINFDSLVQTLTSIFESASTDAPDSVSNLLARAADYEATQPGFAADLRAAAASMSRTQA